MLIDELWIVPAIYILTFGISLGFIVAARPISYEFSDERCRMLFPLSPCCRRRHLDVTPGPITLVQSWNSCRKLWCGQPNRPIEVTFDDHCCGCFGRTYYIFPDPRDVDDVLAELGALTGGPLLGQPV